MGIITKNSKIITKGGKIVSLNEVIILTCTSISSSQIDIAWTYSGTLNTGFSIERSANGINFTEITIVGNAVRAYSDMGLAYTTIYYYRIRATFSNGYSDYSNIDYEVTRALTEHPELSAFIMATHSESDLNTMRATLRGLIYPDGYPATGIDHISTGVAEPMFFSASNLSSIDQLTLHIAGIADRTPYVWHPTNPNGKFVIWHLDHFVGNTGNQIWEAMGRANAIRALIEEGYTVCGMYMPPANDGTEGAVHSYPVVSSPYQTVTDLHYFLDSVIRVLNEYAGSYSAFYMVGLSGGGWTTTLMAALDERITKSAPIAGSLPLCSTEEGNMDRDWEQHLSSLYTYVEYGDLYAMACTSGRKQTQYLSAYEGNDACGFNLHFYNICPYKKEMEVITPNYHLTFNIVTLVHEVTEYVKNLMITFFNE